MRFATVRWRVRLTGLLAAGLVLASAGSAAATSTSGPSVGPVVQVSKGCSGSSAEVETAIDPATSTLYEEWIGCGGIGFASSSNGGASFSAGIKLPQSGYGWDPSIAVGPHGWVYAAFMVNRGVYTYPVVDISTDQGRTWKVHPLGSPRRNNWGDRDFIAVGAGGAIYVTWDYGPVNDIKLVCPPNGSCSFTAGDVNIVMQKSTNNGQTWSPITPISRGYPASGADSAPIIAEPNGRLDVLYQAYRITNRRTLTFGVAHQYFSTSTDYGRKWSKPVQVGPAALWMNTTEWWIDGALGVDAAGNLYATWDSQSGGQDIGWLAYSTNHGQTWSSPVRVTVGGGNYAHILQVVGGAAGTAYVGWLTDSARCGAVPCYAQYLRVFSIGRGWRTGVIRITQTAGNWRVWPGDTIGMSLFPPVSGAGGNRLAVSWGSALGGRNALSQIRASQVTGLP
jgi:hypothetical protein